MVVVGVGGCHGCVDVGLGEACGVEWNYSRKESNHQPDYQYRCAESYRVANERERYGYRRELRAVGNVLRDQYLFLHRCGFDTLEIADAAAADTWSEALSEISVAYQPAADRRPWVTALRQANQDSDAAAE